MISRSEIIFRSPPPKKKGGGKEEKCWCLWHPSVADGKGNRSEGRGGEYRSQEYREEERDKLLH